MSDNSTNCNIRNIVVFTAKCISPLVRYSVDPVNQVLVSSVLYSLLIQSQSTIPYAYHEYVSRLGSRKKVKNTSEMNYKLADLCNFCRFHVYLINILKQY